MIRRVLFCGAWDEGDGYPRATALRRGLESAGVEVTECRAQGSGRGKQRLAAAPWRWPWFLLQLVVRRLRLCADLRRAVRRDRPDVVVVPYPGHHLVTAVRGAVDVPVVLDLFLSAYDTAVVDRQLFAPGSLPARMLRQLDRRACSAADLVLVDTDENAAFVADLTHLPAARFATVPVGEAAAPAAPAAYVAPAAGRLRLLFFGTGVPLHGVPTLVDAVALAPAVDLTLVGGTPADRALARTRLGARLCLEPEFVDRARLQALIDAAALVAGVFGTSAKAARVVPFKVVHALAAGRPVVTADTPAVRRQLGDSGAVFLVPAGDAAALAERLTALAAAPGLLAAAAAQARAAHDRAFAVERSGAVLRDRFAELVAAQRGRS